jgi:Na+/melibiose symporter-like transporter
VNIPIGLATAVMTVRLLEKDKGIGWRRGADVLGAVLITGALMLGVYTIVKPAADYGWGAGRTLGLGALVALLVGFIVREATARTPLIPLRIFRSRNVSGANSVQALFVAGMFGMFFMGALYLQRVLGYDALETGLAFLPATICMAVLSLGFSEKLIMRFGARPILFPGLLLSMAGLLVFTQAPVDGSYVIHVMPVMILLGVGAGLSFPALMTLSMSGATPSDAGLASGLVNTSLQVGGALGLAVLATLSTTRSEDLLRDGDSQAAALTGGYHFAFVIGAVLLVAAIAVALTVLQPERRAAQAAEHEQVGVEPAYSEAA